MKDTWKKHIEEHRPAFELYHTDEDSLWEGIAGKLDQQENKGRKWLPYVWKAAALLVISVGVSWWLVLKPMANGENSLYRLAPELAETESFYLQQINQKMEAIQANRQAVDPALFEDLAQLDAVYKELKRDLKDQADNEEVVRAMIEHHRLKLQILEAILQEIEPQTEQDHEIQL